ncbi:MAG: uroporphyrinogen-III C-methyltransferase [Gammaproteobacteria bacterium]|nr:uroporphyrinogen-III C-methyltransferase [Gammaproteobacteria bacterium]
MDDYTAEATPWPYFPVFLKLAGGRVLVVGGGEVALRKVRLLLRAQAHVEIVARELHPELKDLHAQGRLYHIGQSFNGEQCAGTRLVIAATDDRALNREVAAAAHDHSVPVNVVDDPEHSSFITPAIVDRSPVMVAVSTGGSAPVLARRLREKIETVLPAAYGRVAAFMGRMRRSAQALEPAARKRLWEQFLDGRGAERALLGDEAGAAREFDRAVHRASSVGEVYLVGAGPGDPDLITFRALRLMQQADVVLYDRLVSPSILDLVRRDAERIFVGKGPKQHEMSQEEINALLVRLGKQGRRVLRLKGGDPFIFGRGGEEIDRLAAEGIPFQVVPGITAANGCAAYAGIPLTHRDYAQACIFVTGHARQDGALELHWDQLARPGQTIVIYMGLGSLPQLCARLVEHGLPGDWPAALVEEGTSPRQRVVTGTLSDLPAKVARAGIKGASLVIVGEVVRLRERLRWFEPAGAAENGNSRA